MTAEPRIAITSPGLSQSSSQLDGDWNTTACTPTRANRSVTTSTSNRVGRNTTVYAPIQMSRDLISLAAVFVLMVLAQSNLIDVYGSVAGWAFAAIPAILLGALIAAAKLNPSLCGPWQLVFLLVAQFIIGPVLTLHSTTIAHVLPSMETLSEGWRMTFAAFTHLLAINPPVDTGQGSLMAAWTMGLWLTFLAGTCAIARHAALAPLSMLPLAFAMLASALLGTHQGWQRVICGAGFAVLLIMWLSWCLKLFSWRRWLSAIVILSIATGIACAAALAVPQNRVVLRDRYDPPLYLDDATSPLSGMRSYLKNHRQDVLLTVAGLPEGTPIRLAVMDRFDGSVWNLSNDVQGSRSSNYRRVGNVITMDAASTNGMAKDATNIRGASKDATNIRGASKDATGQEFTATFIVGQGLADIWLPLAGAVNRITFLNTSDGVSGVYAGAAETATTFYVNTDTGTAIVPAGVGEGTVYLESGTVSERPSEERINTALAASVNQPPAQDVPDAVGVFAASIAAGQSASGATATALAATLRDSGWFSHGLDNDYPSEAGHGHYRINALLTGHAMVGDSEQYASAMALMARELGLPSRVVLGFPAKDETEGNGPDGASDNAESTNDNDNAGPTGDNDIAESTINDDIAQSARDSAIPGFDADDDITEFTGNDIAAWVEIKLEGLGWVPFHPTPEETKIPDDQHSLAPPNPQTLVRQPPVPLTDPLRDRIQPQGHSALSGVDAGVRENAPDTLWSRLWRVLGMVALYGSPLWIAIAMCCLIMAGKAILLLYDQHHGSPNARIEAGWRAVNRLAVQCGVPWHNAEKRSGTGSSTAGSTPASAITTPPGIRVPTRAITSNAYAYAAAPGTVNASRTRREQAADIARRLHIEDGPLLQLSQTADYASFSGNPMSPAQSRLFWRDVATVRSNMFHALPRIRRFIARLSLRRDLPRTRHSHAPHPWQMPH